jgi:peroxiredoxin
MRLLVGQQAPDFAVRDLYGNRVALEDYRGVCLLLSFYRFAVCPVCNIRMWRLAQHVAEYQRRGLYFVACIESTPENAHFYLDRHQQPFPMIPDLGGNLYQTYGIGSSPLRILKGMAVHPDMYWEANKRHLGGWNIFRFDGKFGRLPADFLIGPDGRILLAYYGRDHGDFLPLEQLDLFLRAVPPVQPLPRPLYNGQPIPASSTGSMAGRIGGNASQPLRSRPSSSSQPLSYPSFPSSPSQPPSRSGISGGRFAPPHLEQAPAESQRPHPQPLSYEERGDRAK